MAKNYLRLKEVLSERGETGLALAEKLGVSKVTISNWVTNRKQPSIETLHEIADALGVDVAVLLVESRHTSTSAGGSPGAVFIAVEIGKADGSVYLGGVWADLETMCNAMRGRGMKFPDVEAVAAALSADGVAEFDGVNGRRYALFQDVVQGGLNQ